MTLNVFTINFAGRKWFDATIDQQKLKLKVKYEILVVLKLQCLYLVSGLFFFSFYVHSNIDCVFYRATSSNQGAGADVDVNKDDLLREKELKVCLFSLIVTCFRYFTNEKVNRICSFVFIVSQPYSFCLFSLYFAKFNLVRLIRLCKKRHM